MCLALLRLNQRMSQITRTIELKSGVQLFADGLELGHNRIATTRRYKRPAFCVNTECVVGAQIWCTEGFGCMWHGLGVCATCIKHVRVMTYSAILYIPRRYFECTHTTHIPRFKFREVEMYIIRMYSYMKVDVVSLHVQSHLYCVHVKIHLFWCCPRTHTNIHTHAHTHTRRHTYTCTYWQPLSGFCAQNASFAANLRMIPLHITVQSCWCANHLLHTHEVTYVHTLTHTHIHTGTHTGYGHGHGHR